MSNHYEMENKPNHTYSISTINNKNENLPKIKQKKLSATEMYKTMFTKETGEVLNNIKSMNNIMREQNRKRHFELNDDNNFETKNPKIFGNIHSNKTSMDKIKTIRLARNFSSTIDGVTFPNSKLSQEGLKKNSSSINLKPLTENMTISSMNKNTLASFMKKDNKVSDKLLITSSEDVYQNLKQNNITKNKNINPYFYCPHCSHCNQNYSEDVNFEKSVLEAKESQNILKRGIEYIIENGLDEKIQEEVFVEKAKGGFKMEYFISRYTKHMNTRNTYLSTVYFLQALIDDKIDLEKFVGVNKLDKMEHTLLMQGLSFLDDQSKKKVEFEKEIDELFDENMKETIRKIFKSNLI